MPGLFLLRAPLPELPGREPMCRHEATLLPLYAAESTASTRNGPSPAETACGRNATCVSLLIIDFQPARLLTWPSLVSIMRVVGCRYLQGKGILVSRTREPSR